MLNKNDLVPISISVLQAGMKIDFSIYYKNENQYVLLCNDVELTGTYISRLHNIANSKNIYVTPNNYTKMIQNSDLLESSSEAYSFDGYQDLKTDARKLLNVISLNGAFPAEAVSHISQNVDTKIKTVETASIIDSINSIRKTDEYLYTHSINVSLLNGLMGKWLKFSEEDLDKLINIGLLHDIGKTRVPKQILNKPGKLTDDEFRKIKSHPVYSYEILKNAGNIHADVMAGVLQHHEKYNGSGYPLNLHADEISVFARITSVSDIYDAMVSKRVYKKAHSPFEILDWFSKGKYNDLDINYVNEFIRCMISTFSDRYVLLSNGAVAKVIYVYENNLTYPMVEIDGELINTSKELFCVSMYKNVSEDEDA